MTPEELKTRRKNLGLTQAQLAQILDVKENTVFRWEKGILPISRTVELAFENIEGKLQNGLMEKPS